MAKALLERMKDLGVRDLVLANVPAESQTLTALTKSRALQVSISTIGRDITAALLLSATRHKGKISFKRYCGRKKRSGAKETQPARPDPYSRTWSGEQLDTACMPSLRRMFHDS
jgi:hypothetical protein